MERPKAHIMAIVALSTGHLFSDFFASFLPPLMPMIKEDLGVSKTTLGLLGTVAAIFGSMCQPVTGHLTRSLDMRKVVFVGLVGAGVTATLLGWIPSTRATLGVNGALVLLAVMLAVSAVGCSLFHPSGAAAATRVSAESRGAGLSLFLVAGPVGLALAPIAVTGLCKDGLPGGLHWLMPVGLAVGLFLYLSVPRSVSFDAAENRLSLGDFTRKNFSAFTRLFAAVALRAAVVVAFAVFLPTYAAEQGWPKWMWGTSLAVYHVSGSVSGMAAGALSDRYSRKAIMISTTLAAMPVLGLFLVTPAPLCLIPLSIGAALLLAAAPIGVIVAQELKPGHDALAAACMMGLAWGISSLVLPLVGKLGDLPWFGLRNALASVVPVCIAAAVLIHSVPIAPPPLARGRESAE